MSLPPRPARPEHVASKVTGSPFSTLTVRDFPGDGFHVVEKPVESVEKARQRLLRGRLVQDGERTYHAYSADELIEIDSLAHHGRPGMPY
jgi:hypothetical protein